MMTDVLPYLLGVAMVATLGVLFAGVISFAFNSEFSARHANHLMVARVALQAVAVVLFGLVVLTRLT